MPWHTFLYCINKPYSDDKSHGIVVKIFFILKVIDNEASNGVVDNV